MSIKRRAKTQKGRYYFYLNPYNEHGYSCSKCPKCEGKTRYKKIPLAIILEKGRVILNLNKTCRYCPYCELLIAKKCEIEDFIKQFKEVYGTDIEDYFVLGTLDKSEFNKSNGIGIVIDKESEKTFNAITPFKDQWGFEYAGGWIKDEK